MTKKEELLINAAKNIYEEDIQRITIDYLAKVSNLTKGGVVIMNIDTNVKNNQQTSST